MTFIKHLLHGMHTDEAIGDVKAVEQFVVESLRFLGVQVSQYKEGYRIFTINIPERLRNLLSDKPDILVSFRSPTPAIYKYIGRNHPFVEHLSQTILNNALNATGIHAARAAVLRTNSVTAKTVLLQLRVRNVIAEQPSNKQIVAEEMWLWGFTGSVGQKHFIPFEEAKILLLNVKATKNIEPSEQDYWLQDELNWIKDSVTFRDWSDPVAIERANHLVDAHMRFKKLVSGNKFKVVEPILPMDVLGIYILLPEIK